MCRKVSALALRSLRLQTSLLCVSLQKGLETGVGRIRHDNLQRSEFITTETEKRTQGGFKKRRAEFSSLSGGRIIAYKVHTAIF